VSGFSRTDLARFAPIIEALRLLQTLHRSRNHVPVATTISRLLEATRAHVRFALEHGGEQVLANVLHVAELARRYEAEGGISFRGFIDELREQAASGEAGEAPILEEGSDGVRLMTVHKAKGLEFPIVILADMTARLRASAASRYIDPGRRMCAIRLAGCSPADLVQHEAEELLREQAEGVRVAYVAATRARDLLVIPAVGDEARDGWIEPLNAAIYPPLETRRQQIAAPACPTFRTKDSVLTRPNGDPAGPETVCPGLHVFGSIGAEGSGRATLVPITGSTARSHRVVWWDPRALNLNVEPPLGIRHPELIVRDVAPEIVESGMADYNLWRESRQAAAAAGAQPSISVRTVTEWARSGAHVQSGLKLPPVEVIELPRAPNRPSGRRFGTLVHAVLASVPLDADRDIIKCLTSSQGGTLGAPEEEMDAAVEIVQTVLAHPVLDHARKADKTGGCRREVPITWRDTDGVLIEGVIDLAFEQADGWTAIDFKTDEEFRGNSTVYRRQIGMYASAIQAGVSGRVSAVLMRV
jgi:ATP-dependent exoDNAse (exonuclease V) beta subunit